MKTLKASIKESSRNMYEIYFSYKKNAIAINSYNKEFENDTYETINDAVKAIYNINPNCDIAIIPSKKFAEFILK